MLNWIVWNRTVYKYEIDLAITLNGGYAIKKQNKPNQIADVYI